MHVPCVQWSRPRGLLPCQEGPRLCRPCPRPPLPHRGASTSDDGEQIKAPPRPLLRRGGDPIHAEEEAQGGGERGVEMDEGGDGGGRQRHQ
jgi:hypothetical protein